MKQKVIAELVAEDFRKAYLLEKLGIDVFSAAKQSLEEICIQKSLDLTFINSELESEKNLAEASFFPFDNWPIDFLCSYIVNRHHRYVYENIPAIQVLTKESTSQTIPGHVRLEKISEVFKRMARDMNLHMMKEEKVLFPFIEQMVEASRENITMSRPFFGTVHNPTQIMQIEHEHNWEDMTMIRSLTKNYKVEDSSDQSLTILYKKLEEFEADLLVHLDLENRILFPKAILMEKKLGLS